MCMCIVNLENRIKHRLISALELSRLEVLKINLADFMGMYVFHSIFGYKWVRIISL